MAEEVESDVETDDEDDLDPDQTPDAYFDADETDQNDPERDSPEEGESRANGGETTRDAAAKDTKRPKLPPPNKNWKAESA